MNRGKTQTSFFLVTLFFILPLLQFASAEIETQNHHMDRVYGDPNDADLSFAHPYVIPDTDSQIYSGTAHMVQAWTDAGSPSNQAKNAKSSARACTPWQEGDVETINVGSPKQFNVEKATSTVAFLVEDGESLAASVLNDWASQWDQVIYPVMMNYFGKDYNDGRGVAPPDTDNNCQVEVVIYPIDGAFGIGGYFQPGLSGESIFVDIDDAPLSWSKVILAHELEHLLHNALDSGEYNWIDEGAADMAAYLCFGGSSTLYGHVNAWTQRASDSLRWWDQSEDTADYGSGFIFMLYLADHLGGGNAIRNLVADLDRGGLSVENLAQNPISGIPNGVLGTTFDDVWKNFTVAATLDVDTSIPEQKKYGLSNLDLTPVCSGNAFCRVQVSESNSDWSSNAWSSDWYETEGWGIRVFKIESSDTSAVPLSLRLTGEVEGFKGITVTKSLSDGQYTVKDFQISSSGFTGTSVVQDFGGDVEEVHVITWLDDPLFSDCNYGACGAGDWAGASTDHLIQENVANPSINGVYVAGSTDTLRVNSLTPYEVEVGDFVFLDSTPPRKIGTISSLNSVSGQLEILFESSINIDVNVGDRIRAGGEYPVADVMLEASRIVEPATLSLDSEYFYYDRDNNSQSDTVMVGYSVNSNDFAEVLDVEIEVFDDADVLIDSQSIVVTAGGGIDSSDSIWFTAPKDDIYSIQLYLKNSLGEIVENSTVTADVGALSNLIPSATGTLSTNNTLTWYDIQFTGSGIDYWGLSFENNTLPYAANPEGYLWNFGDGNTSSLKIPQKSYLEVGVYNASLEVRDAGGAWSNPQYFSINITDELIPNPIIRVNRVIYDTEIYILTGQNVLFDASLTSDNVDIDNLEFTWDWGDGNISQGIGLYSIANMWSDGPTNMTTYLLNLTVFDGINYGYQDLMVHVQNRPPSPLNKGVLYTYTYTPLTLPDYFEDLDGEIVSWDWQFFEPVNLDGQDVDRNDLFVELSSTSRNPAPSWSSSGSKNINLTVVDDDGDASFLLIEVVVVNQKPLADFEVQVLEGSTSQEIDFRYQSGEMGQVYTFNGGNSFDPDGSTIDSSILEFHWLFSDGYSSNKSLLNYNFSEPGKQWVRLIVSDELGEMSVEKNVSITVINPTPIIKLRVIEASLNGTVVMSTTPISNQTVYDAWTHTFNENNRTFTAVGNRLFFDTYGTRDGDATFENKYTPIDRENVDWNGIVSYTWNFGDASPEVHDPMPWHHYELPGIYTVTLVVRDAYETGDVTRFAFEIEVNNPPVIDSIDLPEIIYIGEGVLIGANISDQESFSNHVYWIDQDIDDGSIYDKQVKVPSTLSVKWEFDILVDEDGNGIPDDDWIIPSGPDGVKIPFTFDEAGTFLAKLQVCDGMGVCVSETFSLVIVPETEKEKSFSEFSAEQWSSWISSGAGSDTLMILALIIAVLILGWMVMRTPTEEEEDAEEAAEVYKVERVEVKNGIMGMDQHVAPPIPKVLSKEERRSNESGYVRPLRRK